MGPQPDEGLWKTTHERRLTKCHGGPIEAMEEAMPLVNVCRSAASPDLLKCSFQKLQSNTTTSPRHQIPQLVHFYGILWPFQSFYRDPS